MLKKGKVPHTFVIVFFIVLFAAMLTWIIPPGKYVKTTELVDGVEKSVMTFYYKDQLPSDAAAAFKSEPQTWQVFGTLFKGFVKQSGIIIFTLMIGGAFWIMNASKAIDVGIYSFLDFTKRLEHNRIIKKLGVDNIIMVLIMTLFSFFGAVLE